MRCRRARTCMNTAPALIGLHGYAGSGKDTVADILRDIGEFESFAFADNVREALYLLDPLLGAETTVRALVDDLGWDAAKRHRIYGAEVRRLMQYVGTEVGRGMFGPDVWTGALGSELTFIGHLQGGRIASDSLVIVTDVRFDNEARWVRGAGGVIWHIIRAGVGPLNAHSSEAGIDPTLIDQTIRNDASPTELTQQVAAAAGFTGPRAKTVQAA